MNFSLIPNPVPDEYPKCLVMKFPLVNDPAYAVNASILTLPVKFVVIDPAPPTLNNPVDPEPRVKPAFRETIASPSTAKLENQEVDVELTPKKTLLVPSVHFKLAAVAVTTNGVDVTDSVGTVMEVEIEITGATKRAVAIIGTVKVPVMVGFALRTTSPVPVTSVQLMAVLPPPPLVRI